MSGKTLLIGGGVGVVGLIVGMYYRSKSSAIGDKVDRVRAGIKVLNDWQDEYEAEWHKLQNKYVNYMNGGDIDWDDVEAEKAVLASLEDIIDAQCKVVQKDING